MEPFVVNGTHIVYARDSISAAVRYQLYVDHNESHPTVRCAEDEDFDTLPVVAVNKAA